MPSVTSEKAMTVLRGRQSPFIKMVPTIEPFYFTGECSRIAGLEMPLGDVEYTECMDATAPGMFRDDSEIEAKPGPVTGSLIIKKSIAAGISAEDWAKCRWNVDVRYQQTDKRRDDPFNWLSIDRVCSAKFTAHTTDDETAYSRDDEGEVLITMPFTARPLDKFNIRRMDAEIIDPGTSSLYGGDLDCDVTCIDYGAPRICPTVSSPEVGCRMAVGTAVEPDSARPWVGLTDDGGQTWTWYVFNGANNCPDWLNPITGIAMLGDLIIAVSQAEDAAAVSQDGGATWTTVAFPEAGAPTDVCIWSPTAIWYCGTAGYIWKSMNSGFAPSTVIGGDPGVASGNALRRIKCISSTFVITVGGSSDLVMTDDGGDTWTLNLNTPAAKTDVVLNSIVMECEVKWAIVYEDGSLYWTDDRGVTFVEDTQITGLAFTALNDITLCGCERFIVVGDSATALGVMYENISGSPNRWEAITLPGTVLELYAIACCNTNLYVAVGEILAAGEGCIVRASA